MVAAASILFAVAPWSGSRSFWLGIVTWLGWWWVTAKRRRRRFDILLGVLGLVMLPLLGYPPWNNLLQKYLSVPGLNRVLKTLNWDQAAEMFQSRALFTHLAVAVGQMNPITGVGLTRFYEEQNEAARSLGLDLHGWRDNANNFYLQVCAELGVLGFAITSFSLYLFWHALRGEIRGDNWRAAASDSRRRELYVRLARCSLLTLLILWVTGPHTAFPEVRYLAAAFIGIAGAGVVFGPEKKVLPITWGCFFVLVLVSSFLVLFSSFTRKTQTLAGVYAVENGEDGPYFWTGKRGVFSFCGLPSPSPRLELRALNPNLRKKPLEVVIAAEGSPDNRAETSIILIDDTWTTISPPPLPAPVYRVAVSIAPDRTWSPSEGVPDGDPRWLGVMVKQPDGLCQ